MLESLIGAIINSTPIFFTVAVTIFLRWRGIFGEQTIPALKPLIFKFVLPLFAFSVIYGIGLDGELLVYLPVLFLLIVVLLIASYFYARIVGADFKKTGAILVAVLSFSVGSFAYPFININFDEQIFAQVVFFDIILFVTIMVLGPLIGSYFDKRQEFNLKGVIKSLATDTILLFVIFAIILNALQVELPEFVINTADFAASGFLFLVIVYIGLHLQLPTIREFTNTIGLIMSRFAVVVIIILTAASILNLPVGITVSLLLTLLVPIGTLPLLYASEYDLDSKFIAQISMVSMLVYLFLYPLIIGVLKAYV